MSRLIKALQSGNSILHDGQGATVTAAALLDRAAAIADGLGRDGVRCAGVRRDNGIDWLCIDLACILAGVPLVPIPLFFTPGQVAHVVAETGMDALFGSTAGVESVFEDFQPAAGKEWISGPNRRIPMADGVAKVTFTSGTTGKPKGVCLSLDQQELTASALAERTGLLGIDTHLSTLPLAVLLENVAGVYGAILSGADIILPPLTVTGLTGSSGFSAGQMIKCLRANQPSSIILLPQILKSMVNLMRASGEKLSGLKYVAVGGARSAPELIHEARALGLPIFEGYGLTECASVVAVNVPGADKPGSVGRPLSHRSVRIGQGGEIEVQCPEGVAYLGHAPVDSGWLKTGDLGYLDADGFLYVNGRLKEVVITAFGRNVSPEWVESELLAEPEVMQTAVFGDDLPVLAALIVASPMAGPADVEQAIARCNSRLPDYARIGAHKMINPFTTASGQLTANGRVCRSTIEAYHRVSLDHLYQEVTSQFSGAHHDVLPRAHSANCD